MRRHEAAHLQDELIAVSQRQPARVAPPALAVPIHADGAAERQQSRRRQAASPDREQVAEPGGTVEAHDARRVERPEAGAAAGSDPDARGDDHDASVREQLQVHTVARNERSRRALRVHRRRRVVLRADSDRRRYKHALHASAFAAVLLLAGCGEGGGGPTIAVQPAQQYALRMHVAGSKITFRIVQPDRTTLKAFRTGSGPHTGVHVIYIRRDLGEIVHHHPPIRADGTFVDTVDFPAPGPYRVVVDVYPKQVSPQPNFQLFTTLRVPGTYTPRPLPPFESTETVQGYRFTLHGAPHLRAIQPAFLTFTVTRPDGSAAQFTSWYGALAHAIFFRAGSLDYFHTHVCAPGASGCTSALGAVKVTGSSSTPGKLSVGVLVPVPGTWRLFLQCRVDGRVLTAPFTLLVR